jgi:outer membrane autotransporter protein
MIIVSQNKMKPAVKAIDELTVADRKAMRLRAGGSVPGLFAGYGEGDGTAAADAVDPVRWSVWASVRGTRLETSAALSNLEGTQYNLLAGASYRWSPEMVVGAFGGYETFKFADTTGATLNGDGYTAGAYVGYRPSNTLRFEGQLSSTWIDYKASALGVTGSFDATRIVASAAVIGSHSAGGFLFEPVLRVTGTWESQAAYVDSAATAQAARSFNFGKVSAGVKVSKTMAMNGGATITPFVAVYADYRFSSGATSAAASAFDDLSARASLGFNAKLNESTNFGLNGEVIGLGLDDALMWSIKAQLGVKF